MNKQVILYWEWAGFRKSKHQWDERKRKRRLRTTVGMGTQVGIHEKNFWFSLCEREPLILLSSTSITILHFGMLLVWEFIEPPRKSLQKFHIDLLRNLIVRLPTSAYIILRFDCVSTWSKQHSCFKYYDQQRRSLRERCFHLSQCRGLKWYQILWHQLL